MRNWRAHLAITASLLLATGCAREGHIVGDAFVVTRGHESVKLGLVEVVAIRASDMENLIADKRNKLASAGKRMREIHEECERLGVSEHEPPALLS
jgi:hypothetical protein